MAPSSSHQPNLSYFSPSPVRGQLEPYHTDSRPGWRYLQCTDTPNELKVLLPPSTAALYAQILRHENAELAKGPNASWDRILEIRHLKDRMIRKCHRISRFAEAPGGAKPAFRVMNAPPDFRLKEMERWLRNVDGAERSTKEMKRKPSGDSYRTTSVQGTPASRTGNTPSPRTSRIASASARAPAASRTSAKTGASSRRRASMSSQSTSRSRSHSPGPGMSSSLPPRNPYLSPVVEERSDNTPILESSHLPAASPRFDPDVLPNPYGPQHTAFEETDSARPHVISPDPLPHPYRPPSGYIQPPFADANPPHAFADLQMGIPHPVTEMPIPMPTGERFGSELSSVAPTMPPKDIHGVTIEDVDDVEGGPVRPAMPRRRSNLKTTNRFSLNGSQKVVSWAMDRDWSEHMTKFDHIVYSAEVAGDELQQARQKFHEEIIGVKLVRENVASALERLRLETERLHLEERALRDHEEKITASFERLQEKEGSYREKVHAVLEETKRVVVAADGKRDGQVLS
ncbi:hypothetical protein OF83DRAFT_1080077 [Amylostereum chailletii]|nr:hypothetical protein OF83DRAFT_1080077 [Amylostereum chailletii]